MIEDHIENGLSELEAIKKIGSPKNIADEILSEQDTIIIKIPSADSKKLNAALIILGFPLWGSLLLAAVLFILSVYTIIWCLPFATGVSAIGLFVAALVSILASPFVIINDAFAVGIVQFGIGIVSIGISILSALLTVFLIKKISPVTKSFTTKLVGAFRKKVVRI
jgi:uncharacterized membrane protein